jgi:hypothetical protein
MEQQGFRLGEEVVSARRLGFALPSQTRVALARDDRNKGMLVAQLKLRPFQGLEDKSPKQNNRDSRRPVASYKYQLLTTNLPLTPDS